MSAFKGWKAVLRLPVQQFTDQPMIPSTGDGTNTTFYSYFKPITDSTGTVTDDETQVTVKVDGVALDPATDYTLTGADGKVVMTTAPADGAEVTITYYTAGVVGWVTSVSYSAESDTSPFYVIGSRYPAALPQGTIEFSMDIERAYVDKNFMHVLADTPQQEIHVELDVNGDGNYEVSIFGMINDFKIKMDMGDVVTASFTITGRMSTIS